MNKKIKIKIDTKISLTSIVVSEILFFVLIIVSTRLLNFIFQDTAVVTAIGIITGVIVTFFSGFIAGHLARKSQVLHGFIAGLLFVLIPTVIFMSVWLYWGIILKATWTGGSLSDVINFIILGISATIFSCFISMCGAKCSELIQRV